MTDPNAWEEESAASSTSGDSHDSDCSAQYYPDMPGGVKPVSLPFGSILGVAPGGVPAYSSDYNNVDMTLFPRRSSYMGQYEGVYTGYRFQCVEYARRWLVAVHGITFPDVGMAYEIFDLPYFHNVRNGERVAVKSVRNGSSNSWKERPFLGSLLIWHEGGYFRWTGHVAVITEVTDTYIRVAEQNVYDAHWEGRDYSRELRVSEGPGGESEEDEEEEVVAGPNPPPTAAVAPTGDDQQPAGDTLPSPGPSRKRFYIHDNHRRTHVLGWVTPEPVERHHHRHPHHHHHHHHHQAETAPKDAQASAQ